MNHHAIVVTPEVCAAADLKLAHEQMQRHRDCKVDRCAWKTAAFSTLVAAGHMTPQTMTPRQRAAARGIPFPPLEAEQTRGDSPPASTLREVLHRLAGAEKPTTEAPVRSGRFLPGIGARAAE